MNHQSQENLQQVAERYMTTWNEANTERRAQRIREVWTEDAIQFTTQNEYHGHQVLLKRITTNYETFVQAQGLLFKVGNVEEHHNAVKLTWEMLPAQGGEVAGTELYTPDVEASAVFYRNLFGWKADAEKPSSRSRRFFSGKKIVAGVRSGPGTQIGKKSATDPGIDRCALEFLIQAQRRAGMQRLPNGATTHHSGGVFAGSPGNQGC